MWGTGEWKNISSAFSLLLRNRKCRNALRVFFFAFLSRLTCTVSFERGTLSSLKDDSLVSSIVQ